MHGWRARIGLMVPAVNNTMECELWSLVPKGVTVSTARIACEREGAAETPDTQLSVFEFDNLMMTFEMTLNTPYMLKADHGIRDGDMFPHWPQNAERVEIYGSDAMMIVGRMGSGWQVYIRPKSRKPVVSVRALG